MYIRNRKQGTNQHKVKAELVGAIICPNCQAINDTTKGFTKSAFPEPIKTTHCHNCSQEVK